eukprot:g14351.t1
MDALREMSLPALLAGAALVACVVLALMSTRQRSPKDAPPIVKLGMPVLGNFIAYLRSPVETIKECQKKYGGVFTIPLMGFKFTYLLGPEAEAPFFKHNDQTLSQDEIYGPPLKKIFGKGVLFDTDLKRRTQQIQHVAHGVSASRLKSYVPMIEKEALNFVKKWGESGETDLYSELSMLNFLAFSRCLLGDEVRNTLIEDVIRYFQELSDGLTPLSVFLPNAPIPAHFCRDKARKEMVALLSNVIRSRRAKKASGLAAEENMDMLQVMMDMQYKDGSVNTEDQIVGLIISMLFGSQHTMSACSTWTVLLSSSDPSMVARLAEEQQKVLKDPSTPLTWGNIGQMELLHSCMREALRMYPPTHQMMRLAKKDFTVTSKGQTFTVPKGHIVGLAGYVAMRLPETFKDPEKFDPDRFGPERQEHMRPFAFTGFGAGRHQCLGQQLAYMQVKTILSVMLREYNIEMVGELPEADFDAMVLGPKGKCMVRYTKKKTAW